MSSATTARRGTGKTYLAVAISLRARLARQRVQFATATRWVARLAEHKRQGTLESALRRLGFIPIIVVDEVGGCPTTRRSGPRRTSTRRRWLARVVNIKPSWIGGLRSLVRSLRCRPA